MGKFETKLQKLQNFLFLSSKKWKEEKNSVYVPWENHTLRENHRRTWQNLESSREKCPFGTVLHVEIMVIESAWQWHFQWIPKNDKDFSRWIMTCHDISTNVTHKIGRCFRYPKIPVEIYVASCLWWNPPPPLTALLGNQTTRWVSAPYVLWNHAVFGYLIIFRPDFSEMLQMVFEQKKILLKKKNKHVVQNIFSKSGHDFPIWSFFWNTHTHLKKPKEKTKNMTQGFCGILQGLFTFYYNLICFF